MFVVTGPGHTYIWRVQETGKIENPVSDGYPHFISFPSRRGFVGLYPVYVRGWEIRDWLLYLL